MTYKAKPVLRATPPAPTEDATLHHHDERQDAATPAPTEDECPVCGYIGDTHALDCSLVLSRAAPTEDATLDVEPTGPNSAAWYRRHSDGHLVYGYLMSKADLAEYVARVSAPITDMSAAIAAINDQADIRLPDGRLAIARDHAVEVLRSVAAFTPAPITESALSRHLDFCGGGEFCSLDDCMCDCHSLRP